MIKNFCAAFVVIVFATGIALGQARFELGVHSLANQGGSGFTQVGASGGAGYLFKGYYLGVETTGGDGFPARSAAFGRYERLKLREHRFSPGFGYERFGTQRSIFGSLGYQLGRFEGEARGGANELADVRAGFRIFQSQFISVIPGFRFRHEDVGGGNINLYSFGLTLRFDQH